MDIAIPNASPVIRVVVAQDEQGNALRTFKPGQTVRVVAEAFDPDAGDALRFKWTDGISDLSGASTRVIRWKLPETAGESFPQCRSERRQGRLRRRAIDRGHERYGCALSRYGERCGRQTAAAGRSHRRWTRRERRCEGNFRAAVPDGDRHVVTVKQPGFAPVSKSLLRTGSRPQVVAQPGHAPADRSDAAGADQPARLAVFIRRRPAGGRARASGRRVRSISTSIVTTRTRASCPAMGQCRRPINATGFTSAGGIYVEAMDDEGKRYDLARAAARSCRSKRRRAQRARACAVH